MAALFRRWEALLGVAATWIALAAVALGVIAFVVGACVGRAQVAFASLASAWLFAAGAAAGAVALSAAIRLTGGRWADSVLPIADAAPGFFPAAVVLLAALTAGAPWWMPHAAVSTTVVRVIRDVLATGVLFAIGMIQVRRAAAASDRPLPLRWPVCYLLVYAVVLSLWAYDLVLGLLPHAAANTVVPTYYFMGAFVCGIAWVALVATLRPETSSDTRHDLGKLLFASIVFLSYLFWSAYFPVWYANVPLETAPLLARWRGPFRALTLAVIGTVGFLTFALLFQEATKRRRATLGLAAALVLAGMLAERFLLIVPSVQAPGGAASLLIGSAVTTGVLAQFALAIASSLPPAKAEFRQ